MRPHNPATRFWPPSATVVSAEPFSRGTGTLRCLQKEVATYRHWSVSLWRDPDDVSHCRILSPDKTEWRLISATLCGWRLYFVTDQSSSSRMLVINHNWSATKHLFNQGLRCAGRHLPSNDHSRHHNLQRCLLPTWQLHSVDHKDFISTCLDYCNSMLYSITDNLL